MKEYAQFVVWVLRIKDGKQIKVPVNPTSGEFINAHNPVNWIDYKTAQSYAAMGKNIGFMLTHDDPFFFVDMDNCLQEDGQTWSPLALEICGLFPGAYVEVSQSGTGLHIIATGVPPDHSCKNSGLGIEFYTESRMISLTSINIDDNAVKTNFNDELITLTNKWFPPHEVTYDGGQAWTTTHDPLSHPLADDIALIDKACKSSSVANKLGNGITFADLWNGVSESLDSAWPMDSRTDGICYDASMADQSLAQRLAFWTGGNCERIQSLMMKSGIARDKWKRKQYLHNTILRAVSRQTDFYGKTKTKLPDDVAKTQIVVVDSFQYMPVDMQLKHFKGCVYVTNLHKVFTPNGSLLRQEQFNAVYSGYVFQISHDGKTTTKKPWEAFIDSQCVRYPIADAECFRPDMPSGAITEINGKTFVNTYVPIETYSEQGDITPFLDLFSKLLPCERDREILISYMAACVQHKGVKFQWCPLIQGAEGNGKTLLTLCVAYAVGEHYVHMPNSEQIAEKYNDWLFRKLLIGVEDVYVAAHKQEVMEILKPMISNKRLPMRAMRESQIMGDNFANLILNSNHRDAIRKNKNDRRICVFYTAQQDFHDIAACGMDGKFFPDLYKWLDECGYARVNYFLSNYAIKDEFNPATLCNRAPITSTTDQVLEESLGSIEQEILEAVNEELPGFAGGWISSMQLDELLKRKRMDHKLTRVKRTSVLSSLGYIKHPGLVDGRANNTIPFDGGKPRLYIKEGHINMNIIKPADIVRAYEQAQLTMLPIGGMGHANHRM